MLYLVQQLIWLTIDEKWPFFILTDLLGHPACLFLGTPSSLPSVDLLLLASNISCAREVVDTPSMAWIQPLTMSGIYAYDTTPMRNSLWPQCQILTPRTTSKIAMNWTNAANLASSARSLYSVSNYAESLTLDLVSSSSLQMPIVHKICAFENWVGTKESLQWTNWIGVYTCPPNHTQLPRLPWSFLLSSLLFFSVHTTFSCLIKLR